jgi:NADH dehydrogenase [ubiquinone] 1 alpha subcomplex assembly factor 2
VLAAQADARWASKKSYLEAPDKGSQTSFLEAPSRVKGQPLPALKAKDRSDYTHAERLDEKAVDGQVGAGPELRYGVESSQPEGSASGMQIPDGKRHSFTRGERSHETMKEMEEKNEDPWKKARGGPSEEWQPQAWNPNSLVVKR